jgi:predicted dehydrogenase
MDKVRWGILSTAHIGMAKVIPAMQAGDYCEVLGIASRDLDRARVAAGQLGIPRAYGSYEEMLADPDIDAVYNPLPNHLHVPWSMEALQAGKHVLCEKPIALSAAEAHKLLDSANAYPELKVMEAFMYRFHPQWQKAKQLVDQGGVGELQTVQSFFSYYNVDPGNIRNRADIGGGGLMDIGCYCISLSRFIFGAEPARVFGLVDFDPQFNTDRLASGILEFERGTATFTCSTQMAPFQRVNILGTRGRIEIEIPFNPPPDQPCRMWHQRDGEVEEIVLPVADQYTLQGDRFSRAIRDDTPVPTPLQDAVNNMKVIDAVLRSDEQERWVEP